MSAIFGTGPRQGVARHDLKTRSRTSLLLGLLCWRGRWNRWITADRGAEFVEPGAAQGRFARLAGVDAVTCGPDSRVRTQIARQCRRAAPAWAFRTGGRPGVDLDLQADSPGDAHSGGLNADFRRVQPRSPSRNRRRARHFDAGIDPEPQYTEVSNRGVVHWVDHNAPAGRPCQERIFVGTLDSRLIALDAASGQRCAEFAGNGEADLKAALREQDRGLAYPVTSPPAVVGDTVVLGSGMIDNWKAHLGLGTVWAYDARSGELRWKWHAIRVTQRPTVPPTGFRSRRRAPAPPMSGRRLRWTRSSAWVFAAAGSASPDYYGGERLGNNRHANSLVALDAITGAVVWSRQIVHHDPWDYDFPPSRRWPKSNGTA